MSPQYLPATAPDDVPAWQQTVVAFLAEKERRSGSRRTVEGYARMLWPFLTRVGSPDRVTPAHVLAWAHGIGESGREPSSATVGARIACLSNERERAWLVDDEIVAFFAGPRDDDIPSAMLIRADVVANALVQKGLCLWTWVLGEKHYWYEGEPTRQRQEIYAAARLSPCGWELWGRSVDYADHEADRRTSLIRERR